MTVATTAGDHPLVLVIGDEPILHGMLCRHLHAQCAVVGAPGGPAEALSAARDHPAHALCVDADLDGSDAATLVAKLRLVSGAAIVVLSAAAAPGSATAAALLAAGAEVVLHKPAGRLPLDLGGAFGGQLLAAVLDAAAMRTPAHV